MISAQNARPRLLGTAGLGLSSTMAVVGTAFAHGPNAALPSDDQIETVNITANHSSLDKVTREILNTPQSINLIPLQVIQQQGTTSVEQALKNVPGITLNAGEGGAHGDTVNLRGFSASDDFFLDGLRDTGFYTRDSFDAEAIEIYKGPASTLFGRGSTGGVINQVSKTPKLERILDGTVTFGTNDEQRETADVDLPFSDTGAVRLNLMDESAHVEGRPFTRIRRFGIAPSLALGLSTPTTFILSYYHETENNIPDPGIPFLFGKPAPVKHDVFYGLPEDDRWKTDVNILTARFSHRFAAVSITDKARYGSYDYNNPITAPHFGTANCYQDTSPFAGVPLCTGAPQDIPVTATNPLLPIPGMPLADVYVTRDRPSSSAHVQTLMNEIDGTAHFDTDSWHHTLVGGIEMDREEADVVRFANQDSQIVAVPLLDPNPFEAFPGHQTQITQRPSTVVSTIGVYAVDTVAVSTHWSMTAALREDRFAAHYHEPNTNTHFNHVDWVFNPRLALMFKPNQIQSYYFSYGTSYDPSAENLSLSARTADLGPERDRTFELGGKQKIAHGKLSLTEAVFDTEMTNARIADPFNPTLQALAGQLTVRGLELDAAGHITPRWEILAGYAYLDGSSVGLFGAGVHGPIPNTAHDQANIWTTYAFSADWEGGLGANYVSRRAAFKNATGDAVVPGYVTFDAMVSYKLSRHLTLRLNGYNLLNTHYYANVYYVSAAENHVVPGAGRTFAVTLAVAL